MESVASPFWKNSTNLLLIVGCIGIAGLTIAIGFLTNKKDKGDQIKAELGIVATIAGVLCFLFAVISYIYFMSYPAYLTNFILILTFINLALSIFAVSVATINVSVS